MRTSMVAMAVLAALAIPVAVARAGGEAQDDTRAGAADLVDVLVGRLGMATAIETACPDYEMAPALELGMSLLGKASDDKAALLQRIAEATAAAAAKYKLRDGGHMQFCFRALGDHGPDSFDPLVVRKN